MKFRLREASIDHLTPGLYRDALELERAERSHRHLFGRRRTNPSKTELSPKLGRYLEKNSQVKRTIPKGIGISSAHRQDVVSDLDKNKGSLAYVMRTHGGKGGKNKKTVHLVSARGLSDRTGGTAGSATMMHAPNLKMEFNNKPVKSRLLKREWGNQAEIVVDPGHSLKTSLHKDKERARRKDVTNTLSHELLHLSDPSKQSNRKGVKPENISSYNPNYGRSQNKYYASPTETHAYSGVAGRLGSRSLKKAGHSFESSAGLLKKAATQASKPKWYQDAKLWNSLSDHGFHGIHKYAKLINSGNKSYRRAGRKYFKEIHKGMEKTFGSRGRTIGRNKLGVPIGKLPEERTMRIRVNLAEGAIEGALSGMGSGTQIGQAVHYLAGIPHHRKFDKMLRAPGQKEFKGKVPKHIQHIKTREELKKWTADRKNVDSRIPVIGRPLKRFGYHLTLGGMVPKASKAHKFKAKNAAYVPPEHEGGTPAVVAHAHLPAEVMQHELGHAKDYHGKTARQVQKDYIKPRSIKHALFGGPEHSPMYQAEVRAWDHAGVSLDHPLRKQALATYAHHTKATRYKVAGALAGAVVGGLSGMREDVLDEAENWMKNAVKRPGAFRAKAEKAGMSTAAFASKVLANKGSYDPRTVKQANLARTFSTF